MLAGKPQIPWWGANIPGQGVIRASERVIWPVDRAIATSQGRDPIQNF